MLNTYVIPYDAPISAMFECDSFFKFGLSKALIGVLLELMICADLQVPYIYQDVY